MAWAGHKPFLKNQTNLSTLAPERLLQNRYGQAASRLFPIFVHKTIEYAASRAGVSLGDFNIHGIVEALEKVKKTEYFSFSYTGDQVIVTFLNGQELRYYSLGGKIRALYSSSNQQERNNRHVSDISKHLLTLLGLLSSFGFDAELISDAIKAIGVVCVTVSAVLIILWYAQKIIFRFCGVKNPPKTIRNGTDSEEHVDGELTGRIPVSKRQELLGRIRRLDFESVRNADELCLKIDSLLGLIMIYANEPALSLGDMIDSPGRYGEYFFRPIAELFLSCLARDFHSTELFRDKASFILKQDGVLALREEMLNPGTSLSEAFGGIRVCAASGHADISLYGLMLFCLAYDRESRGRSSHFLHRIINLKFEKTMPEDYLFMAKMGMAYHTRGDSIVRYCPKGIFYEGRKPKYRGSLLPVYGETLPGDHKDAEVGAKIRRALEIWRSRAEEIGSLEIALRISGFEDDTTVVGLDTKTYFLFSEANASLVRLLHTGRNRRVHFIPYKLMDKLTDEELAVVLNFGQHFLDMPGDDYNEIQRRRSQLNALFFTSDELGLVDMREFRKKLVSLLLEDTLEKYSNILYGITEDEKLAGHLLKAADDRMSRYYYAHARIMYGNSAYHYEGLGMDSWARIALENMSSATRGIQLCDTKQLPYQRHLETMLDMVRFEAWDLFDVYFRSLYTGKGFSRRPLRRELEVIKYIIRQAAPERPIKHALAAHKEASISRDDRDMIENKEAEVGRVLAAYKADPFSALALSEVDYSVERPVIEKDMLPVKDYSDLPGGSAGRDAASLFSEIISKAKYARHPSAITTNLLSAVRDRVGKRLEAFTSQQSLIACERNIVARALGDIDSLEFLEIDTPVVKGSLGEEDSDSWLCGFNTIPRPDDSNSERLPRLLQQSLSERFPNTVFVSRQLLSRIKRDPYLLEEYLFCLLISPYASEATGRYLREQFYQTGFTSSVREQRGETLSRLNAAAGRAVDMEMKITIFTRIYRALRRILLLIKAAITQLGDIEKRGDKPLTEEELGPFRQRIAERLCAGGVVRADDLLALLPKRSRSAVLRAAIRRIERAKAGGAITDKFMEDLMLGLSEPEKTALTIYVSSGQGSSFLRFGKVTDRALREKGYRYFMMQAGRPRYFHYRWNIFRSLDDQIKSCLKDRESAVRLMSRIRRIQSVLARVKGQKKEMTSEEDEYVKNTLQEMYGFMGGPLKRNADKKRASGYAWAAMGDYNKGSLEDLRHMYANLTRVIRYLEARKIELESIYDSLRGMSAGAVDWAKNDNEYIARLAVTRTRGNLINVATMYEMKRPENEPEFEGVEPLIMESYRHVNGGEKDEKIDAPLAAARALIFESETLYSFMERYHSAFYEELFRRTTESADEEISFRSVGEEIFNAVYLRFASENNLVRGAPAYWYAKFYQAIFFKRDIPLPGNKNSKISNPLFEAAAVLIQIMRFDRFDRILDAYILEPYDNYENTRKKITGFAARKKRDGNIKTSLDDLSRSERKTLVRTIALDKKLARVDLIRLNACAKGFIEGKSGVIEKKAAVAALSEKEGKALFDTLAQLSGEYSSDMKIKDDVRSSAAFAVLKGAVRKNPAALNDAGRILSEMAEADKPALSGKASRGVFYLRIAAAIELKIIRFENWDRSDKAGESKGDFRDIVVDDIFHEDFWQERGMNPAESAHAKDLCIDAHRQLERVVNENGLGVIPARFYLDCITRIVCLDPFEEVIFLSRRDPEFFIAEYLSDIVVEGARDEDIPHHADMCIDDYWKREFAVHKWNTEFSPQDAAACFAAKLSEAKDALAQNGLDVSTLTSRDILNIIMDRIYRIEWRRFVDTGVDRMYFEFDRALDDLEFITRCASQRGIKLPDSNMVRDWRKWIERNGLAGKPDADFASNDERLGKMTALYWKMRSKIKERKPKDSVLSLVSSLGLAARALHAEHDGVVRAGIVNRMREQGFKLLLSTSLFRDEDIPALKSVLKDDVAEILSPADIRAISTNPNTKPGSYGCVVSRDDLENHWKKYIPKGSNRQELRVPLVAIGIDDGMRSVDKDLSYLYLEMLARFMWAIAQKERTVAAAQGRALFGDTFNETAFDRYLSDGDSIAFSLAAALRLQPAKGLDVKRFDEYKRLANLLLEAA